MSQELTERQQRFVAEYISLGGNQTQAALAAGYARSGAHTEGHRLLKLPHVIEAIRKEAEAHLNSNVAVASRVLVDLAKSARSESVRLQAAQALLDRGGLPLIRLSEHKHVVEDNRSDAEILAQIRQLTRSLGLDTKVIDAASAADEPQIDPANGQQI